MIDPFAGVLAGALAIAMLAVGLGRKARRRGAKWASARRHARYQRAGNAALAKLDQIGVRQNPARAFGYLRAVPPLVFEEMILTELASRGCPIQRSTAYSGDGGIDGQWSLNGRLWYVQAKRYRSAINPRHVRDFAAICESHGARGVRPHRPDGAIVARGRT